MWKVDNTAAAAAPAAGPETPAVTSSPLDLQHLRTYGELAAASGAVILGALGLLSLARDLGWSQIKKLRSFTLLVIIISLILPMLSPLPVNMMGGNPLDYSNTANMLRTGIVIAVLFIIGAAIGLWWNPMLWLQNAFIFYTIFTVFYTTFFTNGDGFFTGMVGSLGYWLSQQGVERGSQPRYYYALIQMPIYEFLAVLGTLLAVYFGVRYKRFATYPGIAPASDEQNAALEDDPPVPARIPATGFADGPNLDPSVNENIIVEEPSAVKDWPVTETESITEALYRVPRPIPVLGFLLFWAVGSLLAYSFAGERMPWLTVHIALPFLLTAGWGLGYLVDTTDWKRLVRLDGLLAVLLFPVLFASLSSALGSILGTNPPFQGNTLEQLQASNRFIIAVIATGASLAGIVYLLRGWAANQIFRLAAAVFFLLMAILTARAAYTASFINFDSAKEYLVYAHAAPGPKQVLSQVEEISRRTTGGKNIQVAYSNDALYPYWWYLRDYPNKRWFQDNPTRDLREFPIVIAGEDVFNKIEPVLGDNFYQI